MIASPNYSSRGTSAVRLVAIHTAEGATSATALGNYFAQSSSQVSSHVGIDDTRILQYVPYEQAAWTMLDANPISDQAELCGFAAWSRATWLGQHRGMLDLAAAWIRERCLARGIPIRKLTPAQVGAGEAGVCGHWDWTLGTGEGNHTDPGVGFPWDYVMSLAANPPAPTPNDDEESDDMDKIYMAAADPAVNGGKPLFPHGLYHDGVGNYVGVANDAERANLIASGAKLCDGVSQATAAELLRLSRIGEDTPSPEKQVS